MTQQPFWATHLINIHDSQDAASATLLSETKHQTTEVRNELGKLSGKVDELHTKVCDVMMM